MHKFHQSYPVLQQVTYLNTAAHGLVSRELVAHRQQLMDKMMHEASAFTDDRTNIIQQVRATVADFVGANDYLTALVPNFSLAFNCLLEGIDKNASFLLVSGDYPSVNWPVEARGFACHYAQLDEHLEQNIWDACEQHRPDFLALSIVQYISGIKIDLDFIKKLKLQYPEMVIIADATQFVGLWEFRFRESGIDIIAASCYKWLNAGDGNGFICFKEEVVDKVQPKFTGFNSVQGFKNDRGSFMGHFEPGHQDILAFSSLKWAMDYVNEQGLNKLQSLATAIAENARQELTHRNLLSDAVIARDEHSTIFNITGDNNTFKQLHEAGIVCSQRGDGIRISFSYFNDGGDLQKLLNVLDEL
jgi:selenocysteine lyase/cysteine desulfurase